MTASSSDLPTASLAPATAPVLPAALLHFAYAAQTEHGLRLSGTMEAPDGGTVVHLFEAMRLRVTHVTAVDKPIGGKRIRDDAFLVFNEQLARLTQAGMPIEKSLRIVAADMRRGRFARAIAEIGVDLGAGVPLATALEKRRKQFPPLYGRLLRTSAGAGTVPGVLLNIGRHVETQNRLRAQLWRSTAQPMITICTLLGVVGFIGWVIMPQFRTLFDSFRMPVPILTHIVFWIGKLAPYSAGVGVAALAMVIISRAIFRATGTGSRLTDRLLLHVPFVGPVLRFNLITRWLDAVRIGVIAGINLQAAIQLAGDATGSRVLRRDGDRLAAALAGNVPLSNVHVRLLPATVPASLEFAAGQCELTDTLQTLCDLYVRQTELRLERIPLVLTPIFFILIALLMAFIIGGLLLPLLVFIREVSQVVKFFSAATQLGYSTLAMQRPNRGVVARFSRWILALLFWVGLGGGLIGGTAFSATLAFGVFFGGVVPVVVLLMMVAGAILARGARRVRDLAVLSYLDQAVRLNAPLAGILAAAERSERGAVRKRLARLRDRLVAGDAVGIALTVAAPELPRRITGLVIAGENTGRLAAALRRITLRRDLFPARHPANSIFQRFYPMLMIVACVGAIDVGLIFVTPKFDYLLNTFHVAPPAAMRWVKLLDPVSGPALLLGCGVVLAIFCGRMLSVIFTSRGVTLGPFCGLVERLLWFTPFAGAIIRSRALADACHVISSAMDAGLPPSRAISEAANTTPNIVMQRRLERWAERLQDGDTLSSGARAARLPPLVCGMLAGAPTDADAREVFDFLCRHYDQRCSKTAVILRAALIPAMIFGFGFIVCVLALSVFEPLEDLIEKIAGK